MAEVRELYLVKSEKPTELPVYTGFRLDVKGQAAHSMRVVRRDNSTVIRLETGEILKIGKDFFYDPEDAMKALRVTHEVEFEYHRQQITRINQYIAKLREIKAEERNAGNRGKD